MRSPEAARSCFAVPVSILRHLQESAVAFDTAIPRAPTPMTRRAVDELTEHLTSDRTCIEALRPPMLAFGSAETLQHAAGLTPVQRSTGVRATLFLPRSL